MFVHFVNMKNVSKMLFLIFRTWKTLQKRILCYLFDAITVNACSFWQKWNASKICFFIILVKTKKIQKRAFSLWIDEKCLKTYLFILYTKKAHQKHVFSFCNPLTMLQKKVLIFWKNEKRSTSVFSVVKMKPLRKRDFYFDT